MIRNLYYILVAISVVAVGCNKDKNSAKPCLGQAGSNTLWHTYLGASDTVPAWPDRYSNYWAFAFDRNGLENLGIRVTGDFPNARYMSVNVYDMSTKDSEGSLLDELILPCEDNSTYVLNVITESENSDGLDNVLRYSESIDSVAIMLRYYLPKGDAFGGVDLPRISGFDIDSKEETSLPMNIPLSANLDIADLESLVAPFFLVEDDTTLWFYNINPSGLYANADNKYLATPISPLPDEVYMIRFKAPTVGSDVRYWSLSQGDNSTYTFGTLNDEEAIVANDGFVNIVIATPDPQIIAKANGLNLFEKETVSGLGLVLIYRNMVTTEGFAGDIALVPKVTVENIFQLPTLRADLHISDYAPIGRRMSRQAFLDDFGGFTVSY